MRIAVCFVAFLSCGHVCLSAECENCANDDTVSLLQTQSASVKRHEPEKNDDEFVFIHMPYDFGNSVEQVAMFDESVWSRDDFMAKMLKWGGGSFAVPKKPVEWSEIWSLVKEGGRVWGHVNPDLQVINNYTKCPMYLSPPKHWPKDVAKKYFGNNKTRVAIVRDPYEKLVAQFRGAMKDYGSGVSKEDLETCNINHAIKEQLKKFKKSGNMFAGGCVNIPQTEFFEGEFGANSPVDNWRFPDSMNEKFAAHHMPYHIHFDQIIHVFDCHDKWSLDFDNETMSLVEELYKSDFDFICKNFGHCTKRQITCLQNVHYMCPESFFYWNDTSKYYCPRKEVDFSKFNYRRRPEDGERCSP